MAGAANGRSIVQRMAVQADPHGGHAGCLRHLFHFGNLPMTRFAFDPVVQVRAVPPVYSRKYLIDPDPGNRLAGACERGQFFDRGFVFSDRMMAGHACGCGRISHQLPRCRIRVAARARQAQRQMRFVAVGKRLIGRRMRGRVRRHVQLRGCRHGGLSGPHGPQGKKHGREASQGQGGNPDSRASEQRKSSSQTNERSKIQFKTSWLLFC
jgi:hypothetical protein